MADEFLVTGMVLHCIPDVAVQMMNGENGPIAQQIHAEKPVEPSVNLPQSKVDHPQRKCVDIRVDPGHYLPCESLIAQRNSARKSKDWGKADQCRDDLVAMGVVLEDTPNGTEWKIK